MDTTSNGSRTSSERDYTDLPQAVGRNGRASRFSVVTNNTTSGTNSRYDRVIVPDARLSIDDETATVSDCTSLERFLSERHVNMIAFSCVVGVGLFWGNSRVIALAGPGMAFMSYLLMGSIIWSVQAGLGEMAALFPIEGAIFELPVRFLDRSIGYASGWMAWFAWVIIVAAELDAVAALFSFRFDPQYLKQLPTGPYPEETLEWSTYGVSPAVWVTIFLIGTLLVNCWSLRWFGEIQYFMGVLKMTFFVGLIVFQFVLHIQMGIGFKYYETPWGFVAKAFTAPSGVTYENGLGRLAGVWTAMTKTIFSMMGMEAVAITASENKDFNTEKGIKISTRKISARIIILYALSTFMVGLNIPYDEGNFLGDSTGGASSAFIIAAVHAHKTFWPRFMNAFFILSATSCGINSLYLSSRILHALALSKDAWPKLPFMKRSREWLARTTKRKVPRNAVIVSWLFGLLGYLSSGSAPEKELDRLGLNSTVSILIVYSVICVTYIKFFSRIQEAKLGDIKDDGIVPDLTRYDRDSPNTYPYRSNWQKPRTYYALFGCTIMALLNGWRSFSPFAARDFFASYISIIIFFVLVITFRISLNGNAAFNRRLYPSRGETLANPNKLEPGTYNFERNKLRIREKNLWSWSSVQEVFRFIWVWMK